MTLLDVRDLAVRYDTPHGVSQALDGASLTVAAGELVAVVGESGSGKSTLGMAALGLLPASAQRLTGDLLVDGESVFGLDPPRLRRLRRTRLGLVLQDAAGSLDPTRRVGRQLAEHLDRPGRADVLSRLEQVRLPDVERVARSYPHQLSGGMAQRVAIAIALARSPGLLVADEPTAALDTEIKHDVLRLLADSCRERGTALLVLTHDLTGIAAYCTRLVVMYGGRVVETGPPDDVLERPRHPYTRGLLHAVPGQETVGGTLRSIAGSPPVLTGPSAGCAFAPRCEFRVDRCDARRPEPSADAARVLCHRDGELDAVVTLDEVPEVSR
ncbi:ABC transporter ATP-binding protein [Jiangella anatolica]|uniref:ABC transporter ATP-binding protein n=1 Tax=Jiangella anatolica TaxID=2670374 RepID=A0A2W2BC83_9ACTN|nr:ABC transporter ATP-binding protein [Jiangella anatolica]PZF84705.1 ABC transporter ATP-binding protein [Jiangella anatolica]